MQTEMQFEALSRATNGTSTANYGAIYSGFEAKGIAFADIKPRENVLTFHAWKAKGRSVMKGEHGVKVTTFVDIGATRDPSTGELSGGYKTAKTTTVFHISQTCENGAQGASSNRDATIAANARRIAELEAMLARNAAQAAPMPTAPRAAGEEPADRWIDC